MTQNASTPSTKVMTAHVPTELADQVDHFAAKLDRSRAWAIKQALTAWVEQEAERMRLTLEGLEDVKAGRTVDHAAVHAWAQSLGTDKPLPLPVPR
jgi:predicted transcriptional regulator